MKMIIRELGLDPQERQPTASFFSLLRKRFLNVDEGHPEFELMDCYVNRIIQAAIEFPGTSAELEARMLSLTSGAAALRDWCTSRFETMLHFLNACDPGFFPRLVWTFCRSGNRTMGWPDITLINDLQVGFCEVKEKDSLTASQIDWWTSVGPELRLNRWIAKVRRVK